jgi:predicted metal-binding membrane protein
VSVAARAPGGRAATAARLLDGRALAFALAGLSLTALLAWGASPYARYLSHRYEPASASGQAVAIAFFLAGWLLMTAAMTLPTATGLMRAFDRLTQARPSRERLRLRLALVAGFLAVWLLVGYLFRAADVFVHLLVDSVGWLGARPQLVAAAALATAGLFQFSPLKHRCLSACRSPRSFVVGGWRGASPAADALRIGIAYGRSCVGCCWALMLVMFGVGSASLALMLALAAAMVSERFAPAPLRRRLGGTLGALLLGLAAAVAAGAL